MQEITYSVVIPVYNKRDYVVRAVESVTAQLQPMAEAGVGVELIIVDDGSTDDSYQRVSERIEGLEFCQLVKQENQGVGAARNKGIALAKGRYVCFLDADDWWEPSFLAEIDHLRAEFPEAAVYASGFYLVKNGKKRVAPVGVADGFERGYINYCLTYAKTLCMPITSSSVVISRQSLVEVGCFDEHLTLGEDFVLWIKLALAYKVAFVNRPLANYFQDVPVGKRATRRLHQPEHHMLWNLDFLAEEEKRNGDLKLLLDRLRCGGVKRYYLSKQYHEAAMGVLEKVEWSHIPASTYKFYHSPLWLQRILFGLRGAGYRCKQMAVSLLLNRRSPKR